MRRRGRRNRNLDHEAWSKLRVRVILRDVNVVRRTLIERGYKLPRPSDPMPACPAWVIDPSVWGTCYGEWNLDHVKDQPMIGQKAPDDEEHLISMCCAHDERGARQGRVWNTAHREGQRAYLRDRRREAR